MFVLFNLYRKPPKKRNPILIHLNLCIALALGLIVFLSGIETAVDNEVRTCCDNNTISDSVFTDYLDCLQVCSSTLAVFLYISFLLDVM